MNRHTVWSQFMAAALSNASPQDFKHAAEVANRAAAVADYALSEYERRIVGNDADGPLLEPIYAPARSAEEIG